MGQTLLVGLSQAAVSPHVVVNFCSGPSVLKNASADVEVVVIEKSAS
jgi:hypothetical protein